MLAKPQIIYDPHARSQRATLCPPRGPLRLRSGEASPAALCLNRVRPHFRSQRATRCTLQAAARQRLLARRLSKPPQAGSEPQEPAPREIPFVLRYRRIVLTLRQAQDRVRRAYRRMRLRSGEACPAAFCLNRARPSRSFTTRDALHIAAIVRLSHRLCRFCKARSQILLNRNRRSSVVLLRQRFGTGLG